MFSSQSEGNYYKIVYRIYMMEQGGKTRGQGQGEWGKGGEYREGNRGLGEGRRREGQRAQWRGEGEGRRGKGGRAGGEWERAKG